MKRYSYCYYYFFLLYSLLLLGVSGLQWNGNIHQLAFNMNTLTLSKLISSTKPSNSQQLLTIARIFDTPILRVLSYLMYDEDWVTELCTVIRFEANYHPIFLQWKWISTNPSCKFIFKVPRPPNYIFHGIFDHNISNEAEIFDMDVVENLMRHRHAIFDFDQLKESYYPWIVDSKNGWRLVDLDQDGRNSEVSFENYLLETAGNDYDNDLQSRQLKLLRLWQRKQMCRLLINEERFAIALRQQALEENSSLSALLTRCFNSVSDCGQLEEEKIISLTWELVMSNNGGGLIDMKEAFMWISDTISTLLYTGKLISKSSLCREFGKIISTFTPKEISPLSFRRLLLSIQQRGINDCSNLAVMEDKLNNILIELIKFDVIPLTPLLPLSFRHLYWQSGIVAANSWKIPLPLPVYLNQFQLSFSIHDAGPLWNYFDRLLRPVTFESKEYTSLLDLLQSYISFILKSKLFVYAGTICGYIPNMSNQYWKLFIYPVIKSVVYIYFMTGKWNMLGTAFTDYITEYNTHKLNVYFSEKKSRLEKCFHGQGIPKLMMRDAVDKMLPNGSFIGVGTFYKFSACFYPGDFGPIQLIK